MKEQAAFDVVSYDSASWMKPEALWVAPQTATYVPVGTLPIMRITRRVLVKCRQSDACSTNTPAAAIWIGGKCEQCELDLEPEWEEDGVDYDACAVSIKGLIQKCDIGEFVYNTPAGRKLFRGLPQTLKVLCQRTY